jgi:hypothetical protein
VRTTQNAAVLNFTSAHKLINLLGENPRSTALRTPLGAPC